MADRFAQLQVVLRRLDGLLAAAVTLAERAYGAAAGADPFRGLHLDPVDLYASLRRAAGEPFLNADRELEMVEPLAWLAATFGLSPFDCNIVLVALAPEVDLRYQRIFAYLQDDVSKRQPSVELVLNLLCSSAADKLAGRARLGPDAPLLRHDLVQLSPPAGRAETSFLAQSLLLDTQVVDVLLEQGGVDRRLAGCCQLLAPSDGLVPGTDSRAADSMARAVSAASLHARPLRLYLQGSEGDGRLRTARSVAAAAGKAVLYADARRIGPGEYDTLRLIFREALLHDALLYLDGVDVLRPPAPGWPRLLSGLGSDRGLTMVAGTEPWPPSAATVTGTTTVVFAPLSSQDRRAVWQQTAAAAGASPDGGALDLLASRFRLTVGQIEDAVACVPTVAALQGGPVSAVPGPTAYLAAARAQSGHDLAALTRRVSPVAGWHDLVLPADALAQLGEICARVRHRERVLVDWAFDSVLTRGRGTSALFSGPAGTGKTMAAEVIAGELALDLYAVDLAGVVSKYIGETEKNLDRIFRAAQGANAVLLFDEADALFGKRSEVRDSHDRYANIEISYLLQKIEEFDGISILATNLRQHLDEAFLRRLAFSVAFPFPDAVSRARIWEVTWPAHMPLGDDVDLADLAERFALSGGNIRNAALAASYLAAGDGQIVRMGHLLHAVRREYQKLGKELTDVELGVSAA